ncbi:TetR/AcrR family transcriptional regulator [Ornithinimicrobium sediminis]|uniref:TetR/AcrR family transcriptional regulator n=1 Tax=Ornithinimicrobium sediminis TaxID=2904603 RepID=UPI001E2C02FF|nr:TetR/AcrR family transcriptional regulator [Ornithinimicrobium sediminis]MCE0488384.1 TetR/AcrR family transcriptional regulator [Ornithinimicrobium sediminis]
MGFSTSAERGAEVRRRLLVAAAQLIPEVGWHAVSTRAVAERAGVGPGLVHYHFDSVQSLLRQAVVAVMGEVLSVFPPLLSKNASAGAALGDMLAALDDYDGTDTTSLLFVEAYLASTRDEQLRMGLSRLLEEFRGDLASWLAMQGTRAPEDTAAVLVAAVDGVLLHRALNPGMTSSVVSPVLRRLLTDGDADAGAEGSG